MASESEGLPLLIYATMVWRRKLLVIAVALGMAVPAFAVSWLQTPVYQASGQVLLVQQLVDESYNIRTADLSDRQVGIQVALLESDDVAELARREGATGRVRAAASSGSNVITLGAEDTEPGRAAATVSAYIKAFTANRIQQSQRAIDSASAQVQQRIGQADDQIRQLPNEDSTARRTVEEQRANLQGQLGQLQTQRGLVEAGITVVSNPVVPDEPVSPDPLRDAALGLVVGLVLGISLAVLLETVRQRRTLDGSERSTTPPRVTTHPGGGQTADPDRATEALAQVAPTHPTGGDPPASPPHRPRAVAPSADRPRPLAGTKLETRPRRQVTSEQAAWTLPDADGAASPVEPPTAASQQARGVPDEPVEWERLRPDGRSLPSPGPVGDPPRPRP